MNEWNYEELRSKQTELFVLKQILDAYHQIKNTDLYIEPSPLNSINDKEFTTQDFIYQHTGLERLEGKSLIRILEPSSLRGIHISIVNLSPLKELYEDLYESIPATGNLPRIVYSLKKRRGKINGKPFRFNIKSDNYILFRKLVTSPEHRLPRSDAWKAINRRESIKDTVAIQDFSRIVSKLRAGLKGISKDHLRYNKHYLILDADIFLTE